ncbi:MAG: PAS domain S-box protein [Alphaproteobacteria bacterium]|nr:PAS domain S-box protein [Alphaproteobacteria bacterium]
MLEQNQPRATDSAPDKNTGKGAKKSAKKSAGKNSDRNQDLFDLYSHVFEGNIEAMLITGADGVIIHANAAAAKVSGFPHQELVEQHISLFDTPRNDALLCDMEKRLISTGTWKGELWYRRKSGEDFPVWQQISSVTDESGQLTHYIVEFSDITEYRESQDELARRTQELARSNQELEQFAYVASHDLQEPLRMVASYTQLLARRYEGKLGEDADEFIGFAVDGATRMQTLINDLLSYSRVGTHTKPFAVTEIADIVSRVKSSISIMLDECGAEVICSSLPALPVDASQMAQLFQNLIANAIKFRGETPPKVWISTTPGPREWTFEVRDNGIGITQEFAERIFIIFQRLHTKEEYPGTGIGLAVCKKIVERHGGRIWVEPAAPPGATLRFTLPNTQGETPS